MFDLVIRDAEIHGGAGSAPLSASRIRRKPKYRESTRPVAFGWLPDMIS